MKRRTMLSWIAAAALVMPLLGLAEGMKEIRECMAKRLPTLNELKEKQWIGENNRGFLEMLKRKKLSGKQEKVVKAENEDRMTVYTAIARHTGAPVKVVGTERAENIRQKSAPGIMIQKPDGSWVAKEKK